MKVIKCIFYFTSISNNLKNCLKKIQLLWYGLCKLSLFLTLILTGTSLPISFIASRQLIQPIIGPLSSEAPLPYSLSSFSVRTNGSVSHPSVWIVDYHLHTVIHIQLLILNYLSKARNNFTPFYWNTRCYIFFKINKIHCTFNFELAFSS